MTRPLNSRPSLDAEEIRQFGRIASEWWDENGPFRPLHDLNPVRLQFIRDTLLVHFSKDNDKPLPLDGLAMLDIGCGGGLVAEPLTRLGAKVTGIDASREAIEVAAAHARLMGLPITYTCASVEDLTATGATFDVVIALEIVEHVADVPGFLQSCTQLVAPGGALILSTLNRTWKSWVFAIAGAEYIARLVPKGTHDWHKFLSPAELAHFLRKEEFDFASLKGMSYNIVQRQWSLSANLDINYLGYARKGSAPF